MPYIKSRKKRKVRSKHWSLLEIADHLGISLSTVHRMHDEAIIKLRDRLAKDPYVQEWLIERKDEIEWKLDGNEYTD